MVYYTNTACNYACCYPNYNYSCQSTYCQPRCCPPKQKCCCCVTIVNESTTEIKSAVAVSDQSSCGGTTSWTLAPPTIPSGGKSTPQPVNCDCFKFYAGSESTPVAGPGSTGNNIANAIAIGGSYGNAKGTDGYTISWCRHGCNLTITVAKTPLESTDE